jgi:hypothetical protein
MRQDTAVSDQIAVWPVKAGSRPVLIGFLVALVSAHFQYLANAGDVRASDYGPLAIRMHNSLALRDAATSRFRWRHQEIQLWRRLWQP